MIITQATCWLACVNPFIRRDLCRFRRPKFYWNHPIILFT